METLRGLTPLNPHRRVTRAREPNALTAEGAELCTKCWHNGVTRWHSNFDCVGKVRPPQRLLLRPRSLLFLLPRGAAAGAAAVSHDGTVLGCDRVRAALSGRGGVQRSEEL